MLRRPGIKPQVPPAIHSLFEAEGLELIGVSEATPPKGDAEGGYREWIASGMHGTMSYLERHERMKFDAAHVLPGCKSVLVIGMNYFQARRYEAPAAGRGRIARYAWGRDYHNALGRRLKRVAAGLNARYPGERFRSFVDASPLSERFFAERSGLGCTGKNTLLISSLYGSWLFLGEILSTVEFTRTPVAPESHGACPSSCFRCGSACPTGALIAPYRIDARRCISYLTIEHRGIIDPALRPKMGDWVFGCDMCQESCPLNLHADETAHADLKAHRAGETLDLRSILTLPDEPAFRARFAGTPLLRPGRAAMIRNASIAAANTGVTGLLPELRVLARDEDRVISEHARWAVAQLANV